MSDTLLKYLLLKQMAKQKKDIPLLSKIIALAILIPLTAIVVIVLTGIAINLFNYYF